MKANTQKESLLNEIKELKLQTDETLEEASENLIRIEKLQKNRKTSENYFTSMMPAIYSAMNGHIGEQFGTGSGVVCSANTSGHHLMVPSIIEPKTALSKNSILSAASIIQCSRYKS